MTEATYTVGELGGAMDAALREAVGEVWVRGEIAGLRRTAAGHAYFDLCEGTGPESDAGPPPGGGAAKVPVVLFSGQARFIDRALQHAGLELTDGVEVRLRGQPGFYAPHGRLQLVMSAVDPAFTVGQLALSRDRLLAALVADGTVERQKALAVTALPLRIGLVTSSGTAAHQDMVTELEAAGCAFEVVMADARVQGEGSAGRVVEALRWLYRAHHRTPLDLVAIVRGGGSRTDLATFDDAALARAISLMPVPVWTGIGHETDASVADAVAHTAFKTPTAVAAELRARATEARAATATRRGRLRAAVEAGLAGEAAHLEAVGARLARAQAGLVAVHAAQLQARRRRLRTGLAAVLAAEGARIEDTAARLPRALGRALEDERRHLVVARRQVDALDPARVLARGFSVTRGADGRPLTDAAGVGDGELVRTELARGTLTSRVEERA